MLENIGRRLLGALSVTGRFKTAEAQIIDEQLGKIEDALRAEAEGLAKPQQPKLTKKQRLRMKHAERCNKGLQYMYNPLLQRLLWTPGVLDATHGSSR
jgi:hypothetical protein